MYLWMFKIHIYNEMKKQNIPEEILSLITEEEINLFQPTEHRAQTFTYFLNFMF